MPSEKLVARARLNHYRARQCRELMAMIGDLRAITILDDYARDLESRALALEEQAHKTGAHAANPPATSRSAAGRPGRAS